MKKPLLVLCECSGNIAGRLDLEALTARLGDIPGLEVQRLSLCCSADGVAAIADRIRTGRPDRIVVGACSPRDHEETFRNALRAEGMNPYLLHVANLREGVAWVTEDPGRAVDKAEALIRAGIARVARQKPLEETSLPVNPDVLIVGAGPAGLSAAAQLARAARRVSVVDAAPFVGGLPVLVEELFPDGACGACALEPLLDECLHGHSGDAAAGAIEILPLATVVGARGFFGNFFIEIRRLPRGVRTDLCIGCGECVEACPVRFEQGTPPLAEMKKAIDFPMAGALPAAPVLNADHCLRYRGESCTACRDSCPVEGAVDLPAGDDTAQGEIIERRAGAILLAQGAEPFDCGRLPNLGYGTVPDVLTSLDFERLLLSSGPTGGVLRTSRGTTPSTVAFVHCVGSLDPEFHAGCSAVCCDYALARSRLLEERDPTVRTVHLYRELSPRSTEAMAGLAPLRAGDLEPVDGARLIRYTRIRDLTVAAGREGLEIVTPDAAGTTHRVHADMVVLCPALTAGARGKAVADVFDLPLNSDGFPVRENTLLCRERTTVRGIYVAGGAGGPVHIAEAVAGARAATGDILAELRDGAEIPLSPVTTVVDAERCSGCLVCVPACPYRAVVVEPDGICRVNPVLCRGCGACVAACPSGAMAAHHFSDEAIRAEVEELIR